MDIEQRFKNTSASQTFKRIVGVFGMHEKAVLDLGCGFGEYLALFGKGSVGITTNIKEVEEGAKRGFDVVFGNIEEMEKLDIKNKFDIVWANNFFEHILSPHAFLSKLRGIVTSEATLLLGVPVVPSASSLLHINKFRGALASNHINFFTRKTLVLTVERTGWTIIDVRPYIISYPPVDRLLGFIAPHLYVIAKRDDTFSYPKKKLQEWEGVPYYDSFLKSTGQVK
ncbi:MAG: methyltransferase domain-containing protein [Minisyncoccia bacterium]